MGQRKWIFIEKKKNCIASTCKAIIYWEKLFHFKNQGAPKSHNFPPLLLQCIMRENFKAKPRVLLSVRYLGFIVGVIIYCLLEFGWG